MNVDKKCDNISGNIQPRGKGVACCFAKDNTTNSHNNVDRVLKAVKIKIFFADSLIQIQKSTGLNILTKMTIKQIFN